MVLCDVTLCFATTSPERPAIAIPVAELATSGRFQALTESCGLRQWVSRTIGTYTAPTIAALSELRPQKGPALLALLYSNGVLSIWPPTRGALRPMCQVNFALKPPAGGRGGEAAEGPITFTGMCVIAKLHASELNDVHQECMNGKPAVRPVTSVCLPQCVPALNDCV